MKNQNTIFTTILLVLACFALAPTAQAVVPAPDGGYPGLNTAEGQNALLSLTTGSANTAVGWFSLKSDTAGGYNTALGAGALAANTGDQNTATGAEALFRNTVGAANTATGVEALFANTTGSANTAIGEIALAENTTGVSNTAVGVSALASNIDGNDNTAIGFGALISNTGAGGAGQANVAIGREALSNNTGSFNVGINGGRNLTTGIFNIAIANDGVAGESNTTRIGILQNRCFISGIREVTTGVPDAINVMIDSAGQLGTASSSRRFKTEIRPMDKASEAILSLKPVTFRYKCDNTARSQFGLIAEEVAGVNPDLVVRDKNGEIYTVRYDQVNAMLLNEFLKAHERLEEQRATIAELRSSVAQQRSDFEAVATRQQERFQAGLAEQEKRIQILASGLQKVSGQIGRDTSALRKVALQMP